MSFFPLFFSSRARPAVIGVVLARYLGKSQGRRCRNNNRSFFSEERFHKILKKSLQNGFVVSTSLFIICCSNVVSNSEPLHWCGSPSSPGRDRYLLGWNLPGAGTRALSRTRGNGRDLLAECHRPSQKTTRYIRKFIGNNTISSPLDESQSTENRTKPRNGSRAILNLTC
jgi:hypothetical protein